jgi:hypothetical protein
MRSRLFFPSVVIATIALLNFQVLHAQSWTLSGNSNASTSSKLGTTNAIPLRLFTNNSTRIYIHATSGNVGVGTSSPVQKLHVSGTATITGNLGIGTTSPAQKLFVVGNTIITGNVGIGTTNPNNKLHVEGIGLFTQGITASNGGIIGSNTGGVGLIGEGTTFGVYATGTNYGVLGRSNSGGGHGVDGWSSYLGVYGNGGTYGVYGAGGTYGVYGAGSAYGVYGNNSNGIGVVGNSTNYLGGYFYSANYYGIRAGTGIPSRSWAGVFDGNVLAYGTYQTSDQNLKKNIEDFTDALSIINLLKPRSYEFRREGKLASLNLPLGKHYGLMAQDLEGILPDLVKEVESDLPPHVESKPLLLTMPDSKGGTVQAPENEAVPPVAQLPEKSEKMTIKAVNYIELIPILIKALQEQQQQINELKQTINKLTQAQNINTLAGIGMLGQNHPNPVRDATNIQFGLPQGSNNAQLVISDNLGRVVKSVQLTASGIVNVDVSGLSNGVYNYSLVLDNKTLQTRKMTVVK